MPRLSRHSAPEGLVDEKAIWPGADSRGAEAGRVERARSRTVRGPGFRGALSSGV